ncbi:MAG TPA: riboflavin synthase [Anaerohalosphaeraceae bacterium]|jgi:riboflavin synthase|nr:riboflavin synthase [Anaerohalosphaeraceae bacterium]HRT50739.1 riboflavin synthase [Anaerohalosphaeraceae bacterium]HRT86908.1 riboflavin synthase [Anaerohalosphaeraceae bacterium]
MFTGIIEAVGTVRSVRPGGGGKVFSVDLGKVAEGVRPGDSIAVNGVCLTVSRLTGAVADFDVSGETLTRSTLAMLGPGGRVNLERAMRADGRFGGHIVLGHVDGTARIAAIERRGEFVEMRFIADAPLLDEIVMKGSVAVDGISLTVAAIDGKGFSVALIPTTLGETTLGRARTGDVVNIETDILIKAVRKYLGKLAAGEGLTAEKLREYGF